MTVSMALYCGFEETGNVTATAVAGLVHLVRPESVVMALAIKWQSSQETGLRLEEFRQKMKKKVKESCLRIGV